MCYPDKLLRLAIHEFQIDIAISFFYLVTDNTHKCQGAVLLFAKIRPSKLQVA